MRTIWLLAALLASAHAQDQRTPASNSSVSGTVRDAGTGKPLAGFNVSTFVNGTWVNDTIFQNRDTKEVNSITDEQGRYRLGDLPPSAYRIEARSSDFGSSLTRRIAVGGHDLDGIDFSVKVDGFVSGKVLDENKEPVPGITVWLVSREYYKGVLGYFFKNSAQTNDRGEYTMGRATAGHIYLLMAEKRERRLPALSDVPLDPKLRRRAPMGTYYPSALDKDGGSPVVIRPGERREGVNIELKKSPNFCAAGIISGSAGPASVDFSITGMQPSDGQSSSGGLLTGMPSGMSGPDGRFRVCNLSPGIYRFAAWERRGSGLQAAMGAHAQLPIAIKDEDVTNLRVNLSAGPRLDGEVTLEGPVPVEPIKFRVNVSLQPLLRGILPGEQFFARCDLPTSTFSFTGLVVGDYEVHASLNAPGYYIKDITWSGNSVMHAPLHAGTALEGTPLRVTVASDGATLAAGVTDKDSNPQPDMQVLVLPKEIASEAELQARLVTGVTDQLGSYHSHTLAPGKYYVVATNEVFDATPESIGRLWRARNHFQEVELTSKGSAQVSLQPVQIP